MTKEEAQNLKSFNQYCTCGGFAHSMNGRLKSNPHMQWCPQKEQYLEWYNALNLPQQNK